MHTRLSPLKIEEALTRHYLRTDGGQGSGPLKFIDASPAEMARAFGKLPSEAEKARLEFLQSFSAQGVHDELCLEEAPRLNYDRETPGFFRYLMLTCLIASTGRNISSAGQFRPRLVELLGADRTFQNFFGLPIRWKALARWCAEKRKRGEPYREIRLPTDTDIGRMTQIGHSVQIAFPARFDQLKMDRLFGDIDRTNPRHVVAAVRQRQYENWSRGFRAAFKDFDDLFAKGYRLLGEHPFWLAMQQIAAVENDDDENERFEILLSTNIEDENVFSVVTSDRKTLTGLQIEGANVHSHELLTVESDAETLITKILPDNSAPQRLKKSLREGAIVFEETDDADWRAVRHAETAMVRLWLRPDVIRRYGAVKGQQEHWFLTVPLKHALAADILAIARPNDDDKGSISKASLVGGVRLGRARYLGVAGYLPQISASEESVVTLRRSIGATGQIAVDDTKKPRFKLASERKLDGSWTAIVREQEHLAAELSLKFESRAPEYDFANLKINPGNWRAEPEIEVAADSDKATIDATRDLRQANTAEPKILAFLEALYALCEHGLAEQSIVRFIAEHSGFPERKAWDVLRILSETGWIEPRLSTGWRARKWFLRPPRLIWLPEAKAAVLDGAACESLRDQFCESVRRAGGQAEFRVLPNTWSVPVVAGFMEEPTLLQKDVGTPWADKNDELPSIGPLQSPRMTLNEIALRSFKTASTWSCDDRRLHEGAVPRRRSLAGAPGTQLPQIERPV